MIKTTAVATKTNAATNWASDALQTQLNGKNLHQAFTEGLLTNDANTNFGVITTTRDSDGEKWSRLVLKTKEANIPLSRTLQDKIEAGAIEVTEEFISSLVFMKDISSEKYGSHQYFVLKSPSSGLTRTIEAVDSFAAVVA